MSEAVTIAGPKQSRPIRWTVRSAFGLIVVGALVFFERPLFQGNFGGRRSWSRLPLSPADDRSVPPDPRPITWPRS